MTVVTQRVAEHVATTLGASLPRSFAESSLNIFFDEMTEAGITKALIVGRKHEGVPGFNASNEFIASLCQEYPDKFLGIAGIDVTEPREGRKKTEKYVEEQGFKGVAIEPEPAYVDDKRMYPIYAKCEELDAIVYLTLSALASPDLWYSSPVLVSHIAKDFPDMKIAVAHACWPWAREMCGVAYRHPNVYVLPDLYLHSRAPGWENYVQAANLFLQDQLIFGTAYPLRPLKQSVDEASSLPFKNRETLKKYLYSNAAQLFKI